MGLRAVPLSFSEANEYVGEYHRHHAPVPRDMFRVGAEKDGELVGVVQVGRPVARKLNDGKTLEVTRLCTNGERNVASFLYGKAARIAFELGYNKIITYILESEDGTSLKAAGWRLEKENAGGGAWSSPSRPREVEMLTLFGTVKKYPTERKKRYCMERRE